MHKHKTTIKIFLCVAMFLLFVGLFFVDTQHVFANEPIPFDLLAPLPGSENLSQDTKIGDYVNVMVRIIIGIASLLAFVMIVIGGIQYMTTDAVSGKNNAKKTIQSAVGGLLLALGSWLILYTINEDLVSVEPDIAEVVVSFDEAALLDQSTGLYVDSNGEPILVRGQAIQSGTKWAGENGKAEALGLVSIRDRLPERVVVNNGDCARVGDRGCTSLYFTPEVGNRLLALLARLSQEANAKIRITGGSEYWLHKTHNPSSLILDLGVIVADGVTETDLQNLNRYLDGNEQGVFPALCTKSSPANGSSYISEVNDESGRCNTDNHWHVIFVPGLPGDIDVGGGNIMTEG